MNSYYQDKWVTIYHGDCRDILPQLEKSSAIVTDPPYELGFMGKSWDSKGISFQKETWQVVRNVCKSGAMLLSFGGTRTFHRIACAIEDAGFEYRDTIMWVYGSGFPKSLDISKAIDKQAGVERDVIGQVVRGDVEKAKSSGVTMAAAEANRNNKAIFGYGVENLTKPSTPEAQLWSGYGTALKPAYEPIIVAMNPIDGTFANNALKHGVAGLNIDECRVEYEKDGNKATNPTLRTDINENSIETDSNMWAREKRIMVNNSKGRFPANFIHDGSQAVMKLFPNTGISSGGNSTNIGGFVTAYADEDKRGKPCGFGDNGSAARFFYCAKASKSERNKGCEELELSTMGQQAKNRVWSDKCGNCGLKFIGGEPRCHCENKVTDKEGGYQYKNNHPTVKPLALMEYLVKLVKMPQYNLIIDPFMGSGTTLLACIKLGIPCIGIDNDEHSCEIATKRCSQNVMEFNI